MAYIAGTVSFARSPGFFEFNVLQVDSQIEIFNKIKQKLNQGYYISIELDRFYFSGGIEYNKKHLVHPTLIYGYDEKVNSFWLLEDCVQLGHLQEYHLSYSDFALSYQALEAELQLNETVFHAFKIKPFEQSQFLLNNIDEYGINAIGCYADYAEDIVYAAHHKEHLYHICKMPFNMQKRNLLLIELLHRFNIINNEQNSLFKKNTRILKRRALIWKPLENIIQYIGEDHPEVAFLKAYADALSQRVKSITSQGLDWGLCMGTCTAITMLFNVANHSYIMTSNG
ncbi:hypothetical protein PTQ21_28950 [Paenibacillus marchantiae]|uniref:hypothetical protein n=1 Tax=Paenibacillus marchantiae TaxID=3026433 RepID=UPI00237B3A20|nr:hypothetical protein [Paenibacillus marchantiae]WDQ32360.1 hypothetical protein PTQ21_28950 [Paenibacillus marchantiae]